jgi:hypothetical protein
LRSNPINGDVFDPAVSNLVTVSAPLSDVFLCPAPANYEGGGAYIGAVANTTYWFAVMLKPGTGDPAGTFDGTFRFTPAPPPNAFTNDNFSSRISVVGTNVTVAGNNSNASTEPGENIGGGAALLLYTVWYSWTAPTSGALRVSGSTPVPNFFFSIGVYRGNAVDALSPATATPDGGIAVTTGDTLIFQIGSVYYTIWGGGGGSGPFTFNLQLEVPTPTSPNDAFAERIAITTARYHFDGSIYGATNEPGEPLPVANANQTLWWKFDTPGDGLLNILLAAGQFEGHLGVYEGTQVNALTPIDPVNGTRYRVQGGRHYAIQVASGSLTSGTFGMDVRFHSASNDFFEGSEHLEGTSLTYYGNFTVATPEPEEPPSGGTNTVWLSWAAPFNGPVTYSVATAYQFQYVRLFTGPALGYLQEVPIIGLVNRVNTFVATEGTVYHFQFSGGADDFVLSLQGEPFLPANNDYFAQAQVVEGQVIDFAPKSVVGATMELGEPFHLGATSQKSIWWKWQAPRHGVLNLSASSIFIPNIVLAVYQGANVDALGAVAVGTNLVAFSAIEGQTYCIAAAVPAEALGDITCYARQIVMSATNGILPGNILREPSWEGTALEPQFWGRAGSIGGYVNESGGADGNTWPVLGTGAKIWQDITTIPGRDYAIQFAYLIGRDLSGCCGIGGVRVFWDAHDLGIVYVPENEGGFWHWNVLTVNASNTTSRVTFENVHRNLEMDAFSVVDLSAPPSIVTQPSGISTVAGGVAAFIVGANGTAPLSYQWFFNSQPLPGQNAPTLVLDPVTTQEAGTYFVGVSNPHGSVTSASASLLVDAPTNATILLQPYGDTLPAGSYFNLSVVAAGTPPLRYQWYLNGEPLVEATNRGVTFSSVQSTNGGLYEVLVENYAGSVWSLPATLVVTNVAEGGGLIDFRNRFFAAPPATNEAPVFDIDGVTRLNGSNYLAQLYAGPSIATLRPVGVPSPFRNGFAAGFFVSQIVTLPNVPPGSNAVTQVRAWEQQKGSRYEEARALGGKFGRSGLIEVTAGGGLIPAQPLIGLSSFNLQAGLPQFTVGRIQLLEREPAGIIKWSLEGEPGSRYLVEKSVQPFDTVWRPYLVLTNATGTVIFTDSANLGSGAVLYRARLLD